MRRPASTLVVDATVLIAAVRGRSAGAITLASRNAKLTTTDRAIQEARRRIELGLLRPDLLEVVDEFAAGMTVVPVAALVSFIASCEEVLRHAVASRNGSVADAHLLALAWVVDADIWTTDRDFAGTGVATWSTPNLIQGFLSGDSRR